MNINPIYVGTAKTNFKKNEIKGKLVSIDNETFYKISNSNELRPFFMSIVSDSNHWMFISSNGGLTAGRKNCDIALFPYYTDDKITESASITGNKTIIKVHLNDKIYLWEPFSDNYKGLYHTKRNLYKNSYGNKIIFEEINDDLGLTFQYQWCLSNKFGFVKKSTLKNNTNKPIHLNVLDGIQNIMPYGVSADMQNTRSNLVNAYKKNELELEIGLGIYTLSAIIIDRAEPSEALKANIVWSLGIEKPTHLLSSLQLDNFRKGKTLKQETEVKAEKGAYFISTQLTLQPEKEKGWLVIANVNQSLVAINEISEKIKREKNLAELVLQDIERGTNNLLKLAGNSDGLQLTADRLRNTRHFSNTLFNIMRGGIFDENYKIEKEDFIKYIKNSNKKVLEKKENILEQFPNFFTLNYLKNIALQDEDKNFKRLCFEYMPLKFSRRHGDPSRPWNKFSINTRSEIDGSKILDYEGNWRDIFQNWEALVHSYPEFIESMIHKFLNATTFDGYNPYRITKNGFDWEVIEPDDPWSYIGYWGDHQIIYLLKFLEFAENYFPTKLADYFNQDLFVYANVPYKIKSYTEILKNPKDTIDFDQELNKKINKQKTILGADAALLPSQNNTIYTVNLIEKLLVTVLAKISNFIPEGGIWLNTQRPEWNDANNALVGNGVSMVTLYYLRRFLNFFEKIVGNSSVENMEISEELSLFFNKIVSTFDNNQPILSGKISNVARKKVLDELGLAGSDYRNAIYKNGFNASKTTLTKEELLHFFRITKTFLNHTIEANKRNDNLYHSYNLMTLENDSEISILNLPEMLEGQVAILSSGYLSSKESLEVLDSLKNSALFRPDQYSYLLYPNKELPRFVDKNNIPKEKVKKSKLLQQLLKDGNSEIIERDVLGNYHFNGNFNNVDSLKPVLSKLSEEGYKSLVQKESTLLFEIFEEIFNHKEFTGRSGTFFGYEGLGSIYWHMVSKLLLAVQETCITAINNRENKVITKKLLKHYYDINEGLGVHKSPELYGAFPTDPYSHTPAKKGAQQPGMTGQVKEDILSRFGELGIFVNNGELHFSPSLLSEEEFLKETKIFNYIDVNKQEKEINLNKNSLCFTYCQVPVIYKIADKNSIKVTYNQGNTIEFNELKINSEISKHLFERNGKVEKIIILLKTPFI